MLPLANLLCGIGFSVSFPFLPLMVRGLGVQENLETWVGYMMLAFYMAGFVANPIWGGIADHYGRKLMVLRASARHGRLHAHGAVRHDAALVRVPVRDGRLLQRRFVPRAWRSLVAKRRPAASAGHCRSRSRGRWSAIRSGPAVGGCWR